ncbi:inositol monophosphatase family protein [Aporhodopirellula aestuarii]|uniref:Inositol-1-monophosphatase n=1 Tax=Aporhodopirellula aestuarii TaxID=2950107 RepID=A0ABT0TZ87_9BACT|nr:inositol monophosphatase family protein [Aporhodopirellula aestuarii]MCM2369919.1 inositol monophosphatase [Aporhodopirellula aestuarii]
MTNVQQILQTAIAASHTGGAILRRYFEEGVIMRDKSQDGGKSYDLVSDADEQSEAAIATLIRDAYPTHELLGEESLQGGDVDSDHLWIIDPLDGTNNFAHRIEHFAVSIGYYENGQAAAGAIYNPVHDDLFTAVRGEGAFRNGKQVHVSDADTLGRSMIGCGFYYDRGAMMKATLAAIEDCFSHHIHGIRRFGTASLDLCMVGCGKLEGFFEYNLSPWDFAAGSLFVTEAGGKITDARGGELPIGSSSVVATNGHLHNALTEITRRHHP